MLTHNAHKRWRYITQKNPSLGLMNINTGRANNEVWPYKSWPHMKDCQENRQILSMLKRAAEQMYSAAEQSVVCAKHIVIYREPEDSLVSHELTSEVHLIKVKLSGRDYISHSLKCKSNEVITFFFFFFDGRCETFNSSDFVKITWC